MDPAHTHTIRYPRERSQNESLGGLQYPRVRLFQSNLEKDIYGEKEKGDNKVGTDEDRKVDPLGSLGTHMQGQTTPGMRK